MDRKRKRTENGQEVDKRKDKEVERKWIQIGGSKHCAYLWVEEDLGPQEALVAYVNGELLLGDGVDASVLFDPLGAVRVVLVELLHQVGTHVAKTLLEGKQPPRLCIRHSRW